MRPEIAETVKRLEGLANCGVLIHSDDVYNDAERDQINNGILKIISELQRVSLELVFANARIVERNAEIARLSAPVAGTYLDACKAACPNGCGANIDIGTALSNGRGFSVGQKVHYSKDGLPSANFPCTASTALEWGEQNARELTTARTMRKNAEERTQKYKELLHDLDDVMNTYRIETDKEIERLNQILEDLDYRPDF